MNDHCKALLLELEEQLKYIALETDNPLSSAELSFQVVQNNLKNLKQFIVKYKFKSTDWIIFTNMSFTTLPCGLKTESCSLNANRVLSLMLK